MSKVTSYKGFKIKPATKRTCEFYGIYTEMEGMFLIINRDGQFEHYEDTIERCKDWIDCY